MTNTAKTLKAPYNGNVFSAGYDASLLYTGKDAIAKAVKNVIATGRKFEKELHKVAVSCLAHAAEHGDFTLASKLVNGLRNGRDIANGSARVKGLVVWFETFAPMAWRPKSDSFTKNKGEDANPFNVEKAALTPFWDLSGENTPEPITLETVYKLIAAAAKKTAAMAKQGDGENAPENLIVIEGEEAVKKVENAARKLAEVAALFAPDEDED